VRSIQTHSSWVFIASPFVFKVKKPVNLGFLDFSTLEKRHHFCRRELELNRRLCPEVYLAVMPIYESDAGFSFDDEDGEVAEYSVKMRELPHGRFLRELVAKGLAGEIEINRVIACLHRFYESETPSPEIRVMGHGGETQDQHGRKFCADGTVHGRNHFASCSRNDPALHQQLLRREGKRLAEKQSAQ
jgi:aminoglycoside phosphotransferase family enzyme